MFAKLSHQLFQQNSIKGSQVTQHFSNYSIYDSNVDSQSDGSQCKDWATFRDIKCIKTFEIFGLQNFEDALNACKQISNDSNLITISSAEEYHFLTNFLFNTTRVVDNVWIASKYIDSQYRWVNGLNLTFSNWAEGYPKNKTDSCVEINSDPDSVGKWIEVSCKRQNLVVCQRLQLWSMDHMKESLLNLQETVANFKQTEASLKQNMIPIGFIYVQFPNEKPPKEIWPRITWVEITSSYAGLFFRAFGGNSSSFGILQEEHVPRIIAHESMHIQDNYVLSSNFSTGDWSNWVYTGDTYDSANSHSSKFLTSGGEVRPRNTAIRVWKRSK